MTQTLDGFNQLVNAEEYFEFFQLPYDPQVVNVNRLHILQKFSALIKPIASKSPDLSESELLERYQLALQQAYETFITSSPLTEKLFKVFNDKAKNVVMLSQIGSD